MYFEYEQSAKNHEWYWRLKAANHQTIAVGGEGYVSESNVKEAIDRIRKDLSNVPVKKV